MVGAGPPAPGLPYARFTASAQELHNLRLVCLWPSPRVLYATCPAFQSGAPFDELLDAVNPTPPVVGRMIHASQVMYLLTATERDHGDGDSQKPAKKRLRKVKSRGVKRVL